MTLQLVSVQDGDKVEKGAESRSVIAVQRNYHHVSLLTQLSDI